MKAVNAMSKLFIANGITKMAMAQRLEALIHGDPEQNHPIARTLGGMEGATAGATVGVLAALLHGGRASRRAVLPLTLGGAALGAYGGQHMAQRLMEHWRKSASAHPENPGIGASVGPLPILGNPRGTAGDAARVLGRRLTEGAIGGASGYALGAGAGSLTGNPRLALLLSRIGGAAGSAIGAAHGGWEATKNFNKRRYPEAEKPKARKK
jgi:hypothetical protein